MNRAALLMTERPPATTFFNNVRAREDALSAKFVYWAFYIFIFSLPLESIELGVQGWAPSIAGFCGYGFVLVSLTRPQLWSIAPPRTFWWFAAYNAAAILMGFIHPSAYYPAVAARIINHLQMLALFWISCSLFRDERVRKNALCSLALSCSLLSFFQVLGIGGVDSVQESRASAFGANANEYAWFLASATISIFGLLYRSRRLKTRWLAVALPAMALLIIQVVRTGSRGGILALLCGFIAFSLGDNLRRVRLRNLASAAVVVLILVSLCLGISTIRERFEQSIFNGDLAERQIIYPASIAMIEEKPLLGWGPYNHLKELHYRVPFSREDLCDTHNVALFVFTEVGLVGGLPFIVGLAISYLKVWRARKNTHVAIALALFSSLMVMSISGSVLIFKLFWLLLAFALAESNGGHNFKSKHRAVPARRPTRIAIQNLSHS